MAGKKSKPGRARDRGETVRITVELRVELDAAIEECAEKETRTKKAIVVLALKEYLAARGLYPHPGDKS